MGAMFVYQLEKEQEINLNWMSEYKEIILKVYL